jgi:hypothetical protein
MKKFVYTSYEAMMDEFARHDMKVLEEGYTIIDDEFEYYIDPDSKSVVKRRYDLDYDETDQILEDMDIIGERVDEIHADCLELVKDQELCEEIDRALFAEIQPENHYRDCVDAATVALVSLITAAATCVAICAVAASPVICAIGAIMAGLLALGAIGTAGLLFFAKKQEKANELYVPKNLGFEI